MRRLTGNQEANPSGKLSVQWMKVEIVNSCKAYLAYTDKMLKFQQLINYSAVYYANRNELVIQTPPTA